MSALDFLFGQVQNAIMNHASPNTPGPSYDPNPLLGTLSSIFGQHAQSQGQPFSGGIAPASQDPYGDPANQGGFSGGIAPASQDPYGDPANQGGGTGGIAPASQDPYGDPADQR